MVGVESWVRAAGVLGYRVDVSLDMFGGVVGFLRWVG